MKAHSNCYLLYLFRPKKIIPDAIKTPPNTRLDVLYCSPPVHLGRACLGYWKRSSWDWFCFIDILIKLIPLALSIFVGTIARFHSDPIVPWELERLQSVRKMSVKHLRPSLPSNNMCADNNELSVLSLLSGCCLHLVLKRRWRFWVLAFTQM
jgi:hypothetical protein